MTISEIQNQLLGFYLSQSIFILDKDLNSIVIDDRDKEALDPFKREMVVSALENLERLDMVKMVKKNANNEANVFVLTKPIMSYPQNVSISPYCALSIASLVNSFLAASSKNVEAEKCNALNISEKDLINLVEICKFSIEESNEEGEDEE